MNGKDIAAQEKNRQKQAKSTRRGRGAHKQQCNDNEGFRAWFLQVALEGETAPGHTCEHGETPHPVAQCPYKHSMKEATRRQQPSPTHSCTPPLRQPQQNNSADHLRTDTAPACRLRRNLLEAWTLTAAHTRSSCCSSCQTSAPLG